MVWHAYQLNPRNFLEDCIRYGKLQFWTTGFPWALVNDCIDNETFEFQGNHETRFNFEAMTGLPWNSLSDDQPHKIRCPQCASVHSLPWTLWGDEVAWITSSLDRKKLTGEFDANGYADKNFNIQASCGLEFDHELLKTQKFRSDMLALRSEDVPLPGTILDIEGNSSSSTVFLDDLTREI